MTAIYRAHEGSGSTPSDAVARPGVGTPENQCQIDQPRNGRGPRLSTPPGLPTATQQKQDRIAAPLGFGSVRPGHRAGGRLFLRRTTPPDHRRGTFYILRRKDENVLLGPRGEWLPALADVNEAECSDEKIRRLPDEDLWIGQLCRAGIKTERVHIGPVAAPSRTTPYGFAAASEGKPGRRISREIHRRGPRWMLHRGPCH